MEFVYLMMNSYEWEDIVVYLSEEEAIRASYMYPNIRIEIFGKNIENKGYSPTYNYYKAGRLYRYSD